MTPWWVPFGDASPDYASLSENTFIAAHDRSTTVDEYFCFPDEIQLLGLLRMKTLSFQ